jgi:hypothetical protein
MVRNLDEVIILNKSFKTAYEKGIILSGVVLVLYVGLIGYCQILWGKVLNH